MVQYVTTMDQLGAQTKPPIQQSIHRYSSSHKILAASPVYTSIPCMVLHPYMYGYRGGIVVVVFEWLDEKDASCMWRSLQLTIFNLHLCV